MKKIVYSIIAFSCLTLGFSGNARAESPDKVQIVIMGTTDVHGNIYPIDYFTGNEKKVGLAKIFTKVKEIRSANKNTLLLDSGDFLQGTPLTNYYGRIAPTFMNPMIKAMNLMKYDALGIGNHEYDYGIDNLKKAVKDASFPLLSANTYFYGKNETVFKPYVIKNINGINVGIIGFTTPGVAVWSKGIVDKKYLFEDIVSSAKKWIPELKKKSDLIIAIPHSGLEDEKDSNDSPESVKLAENAGKALASNFPQIDVLLLGHSHTEIKEMFENGVLISQPKPFGMQMSVVTINLEKEKNSPKGAPVSEYRKNQWKVIKKYAETIDLKDTDPDKLLLEALKEEHLKTLEYVNTSIGNSMSVFTAKGARFMDTPIVDLINKVQLEATGADLSSASLFNENSEIPKGSVSIANIAGLYIYENTLMAIKITGRQLKEYLEFSARYFKNYEAGKIIINDKVPGYNFDMVSGVDYKIDLTRAVGERIIGLKYKGNDIKDDMTFTMALNSYRQGGGGGYDMLKGSPVVYNKLESIRDLIINYIQKKGTIYQEDVFKKNWEIINSNTEKR